MKEIKLMFWAIGKKYSFNNDQIQLSEGIISKKLDTINFVDVKDIKTTKNLFGWGTISVEDINGVHELNLVKGPSEIHAELNAIFLEHKNRMKKVDIS